MMLPKCFHLVSFERPLCVECRIPPLSICYGGPGQLLEPMFCNLHSSQYVINLRLNLFLKDVSGLK